MKKIQTRIIDRRDFLKFAGLGIAGVTFVELPFNKLLRIGPAEPEWVSSIEKSVTTVCQLCSGSCGIKVRTIDGYPVSVSGNEYHPINRGRLCPKGLSALQSYYHPARIEGPQVLTNGTANRVSWEEVIRLVSGKIKECMDKGHPERIAFYHDNLTGLSSRIAGTFMKLIGSENFSSFIEDDALRMANYFTFGNYQHYAYDFENSNFILSFGGNLLDAWESPLFAQNAISRMREHKKYAQLIQIEPRFSTTAARANEWIPIRPGTEGAFALGMAYVIIKEQLYDASFVENHTYGFEGNAGDNRKSFKELVFDKYHPETVANITGVRSSKIIETAKLFSQLKPSIAVIGRAATGYHNGIFNALAVNALNALMGNIDKAGGILKPRKLFYPGYENSGVQPDVPVISPHGDFYENLPDLDILFIYNSNPAYYNPLPEKFIRWMKKIPVTISFSNVWNETASVSNYILPEHHFLDRWQDVISSDVFPYPVVGLSQPVRNKPLHDTRHIIDILSGIMSSAEGKLKSGSSLSSSEDMIKEYFKHVYDSHNGTVFVDEFETQQIKKLEERGWWSDSYGSFSAFWNALISSGGWWDPAYTFGEWGRIFTSPSGKYEFYSRKLADEVRRISTDKKFRDSVSTSGDILSLPHYEKNIFSSNSKNYSLYLNVYEPISFINGTGGDLPWLLENPTSIVDTFWETWIEINPDTAKTLHISDGDIVTLESPHGRIEARVKYFPAAQPDVVSVPLGLGRKSFHRDIPSAGSNILDIVSPIAQLFVGKPALQSTLVKIYKK